MNKTLVFRVLIASLILAACDAVLYFYTDPADKRMLSEQQASLTTVVYELPADK